MQQLLFKDEEKSYSSVQGVLDICMEVSQQVLDRFLKAKILILKFWVHLSCVGYKVGSFR